jgi:hypothetical protein
MRAMPRPLTAASRSTSALAARRGLPGDRCNGSTCKVGRAACKSPHWSGRPTHQHRTRSQIWIAKRIKFLTDPSDSIDWRAVVAFFVLAGWRLSASIARRARSTAGRGGCGWRSSIDRRLFHQLEVRRESRARADCWLNGPGAMGGESGPPTWWEVFFRLGSLGGIYRKR